MKEYMRESIKARRLRLWKARQTAEGYDVSKVNTLEEAEHFFDKKVAKNNKKPVKSSKKTEEPIEEDIVVSELEVQAVANAIVEQAEEDNKTVEEVVTEIVNESTEQVEDKKTEEPIEGE